MKKERLEYIDICKALGILIIISFHVGFGARWDHFAHTFAVQLFFFISGFLLPADMKSHAAAPFIKKRVKTLLLPYAVFGLFFFAVQCILKGFDIGKLVALFFINTDNMPIVGALWFLTALFSGEVIYYLLASSISSQTLLSIAAAAVALCGNLVSSVLPFDLPYALGPGMVAVAFLHLGRLCGIYRRNSHVSKLFSLKLWQVLLAICLLVPLAFLNGYVNIRRGLYSNIPLFWLNSLMSILILINISLLIEKNMPQGRLRAHIAFVGRNSLVYMILNEAVIFFVDTALSLLPVVLPAGFAAGLLRYALVLITLWPCALILERTKLKVLLGKF